MIYLDNAATTFPKPQSVLKSAVDGVRIYGGNPGRSGHKISMRTSQKIFSVREQFAGFFHVSVEQIVFTSNCTHALNLAIKGVMQSGGHIILSNLEHNSVIRPIHALHKKGNVEYDIASVCEGDPEQTLKNFAKLLKPNTKAIVCTHASNVTGMIMPIRELGQLCRQRGLFFIVDAAQTAGVLPIDMKAMNIDILCTAGHKGLYGTTGTGLMVLNTDKLIDTLLEGGTGSVSIDLNQPEFLPDRYESGTINTVGICSMGAGLNFIRHRGLDRIYRHEFQLCSRLYNELSRNPNIKTYIKDFRPGEFVPIVLFNINGKTSTEAVEQLSRKGICLRGGLHCAPLIHRTLGTEDIGAIRVSPSIFNTQNDISLFLKELKQICK